MNSYEVLPPAVDRKTLLKCESSVLGSRTKVGKERSRPPRGGGLVFPSPTGIQNRAPERFLLSLALTSHWQLETSEGLSL